MDLTGKKNGPPVVNVYLKKSSESGPGHEPQAPAIDCFPDIDQLSLKYGIHIPEAPCATADNSSMLSDFKEGSDFIDRTEVLIRKLAKKDQEMEKLCVLLETLEPIPGVCVDSMRRHLDGDADNSTDFRDLKIVSLAKKNRNLIVMLNKERASADSRGIQIQQLTDRIQQLEKSNTSTFKKDGSDGDSQHDALYTRREVAAANKSADDLRRKLFQSSEENKKLTRALLNELGDSATVDQAVEGAWRGRAQQIIMLKAKIKKLMSTADDTCSSVTLSTAATHRSKRADVDTIAQEELAEMSQERKHAIEFIIEEKEVLLKGNQQLEEKVQAHRARIRNLEADAYKQKQQIKVVLDVKEGDDELIDALQQEIQRFKLQAKGKGSAAGINTKTPAAPQGGDSSDLTAVTADVSRLRRLCKSQADQISAQDDVIRSLRSRLS